MMDIGLQEVLVGVGVLAILAIVLDGIRRHRRQKSPEIRMDLDLTGSVSGDPFNPELPAGGARQAGGDALSSVAQASSTQGGFGDTKIQPTFGKGFSAEGMPNLSAVDGARDTTKGPSLIQGASGDQVGLDPRPLVSATASAPGLVRPARTTPRQAFDAVGEGPGPTPASVQPRSQSKPIQAPTDVLGITVQSMPEQSFSGADLMQRFIEAGLRYGQHDVFHLYDVDSELQEMPLISVTNATEPRTFDLATMADLATSAITLYMPLPVSGEPEAAFGRFLTLADQLAKALNGQLCDLYQKPLTQTTLTKMHQRLLKVCEAASQDAMPVSQDEGVTEAESKSDEKIDKKIGDTTSSERIAVTD